MLLRGASSNWVSISHTRTHTRPPSLSLSLSFHPLTFSRCCWSLRFVEKNKVDARCRWRRSVPYFLRLLRERKETGSQVAVVAAASTAAAADGELLRH